MDKQTAKESFEIWYKEEYSWEMKRGRGKLGLHLEIYDGDYISDHARMSFKAWCSALGVK